MKVHRLRLTSFTPVGEELFDIYPAFRESILEMDDHVKSITGQSIRQTYGLFGGPTTELPRVWPIYVTLVSLAMLQVGLTDLLSIWGIHPDIVMGHSAGETAMLYSSCGASRKMVVELAVARGQALTDLEACDGTMAALSCSKEQAASVIATVKGRHPSSTLEIACINGPDAITVAGLNEHVQAAVDCAQEEGYFAVKLRTRVAMHSSLLDRCRPNYEALVGRTFANHPSHTYIPRTRTLSTLTGLEKTEPFTAEYFWSSSRSQVKFSQSLSHIAGECDDPTFIEIGPHPVLSSYIEASGFSASSIISPMRRPSKHKSYGEENTVVAALAKLFMRGHNNALFCQPIDALSHSLSRRLPPYPFSKKDIQVFPDTSAFLARQMNGVEGRLSGPNLKINVQTHPIIAQHVINGVSLLPAAGFIEMVNVPHHYFDL